MPMRLLRDGILDSDAVCSLSFPAEVFYRRLMSAVDDFGRFDGRLSVLRSRLYALQIDKVREADITRWIAECEKAGLIALYSAVGKPYILFHKLGSPRAKESKFPAPPADESNGKHLKADESNGKQMLSDAPYSYSGTDTSTSSDTDTDSERLPRPKKPSTMDFERFWNAYPRKESKAKAAVAFAKLNPDEPLLNRILVSLSVQSKSDQWNSENGRYVPHPTTWLNARRWEDEDPAPRSNLSPKAQADDAYAAEVIRIAMSGQPVVYDYLSLQIEGTP